VLDSYSTTTMHAVISTWTHNIFFKGFRCHFIFSKFNFSVTSMIKSCRTQKGYEKERIRDGGYGGWRLECSREKEREAMGRGKIIFFFYFFFLFLGVPWTGKKNL
jgi:hypothetical protein